MVSVESKVNNDAIATTRNENINFVRISDSPKRLNNNIIPVTAKQAMLAIQIVVKTLLAFFITKVS